MDLSMKNKNFKINVLGEKYKLNFEELNGHGIEGLCQPAKKIISLDKSLEKRPDDLQVTLIHEIGHCIFHESSLCQAIGHDIEEVIVDLFGKVLTKNFKLIPK